jgi:hypothetical protein
MRPIPFAEFRNFLQRLGYVQKRNPGYCVFDHPQQEGLLAFRLYGDDEPVIPLDLERTRAFLDLRGVIEAEDFDAQLLRADPPG